MLESTKYAVLIIPYSGVSSIHDEIYSNEKEAYEAAHKIQNIKPNRKYCVVYKVKEALVEYTQTLIGSTTYYDTYKVYNKDAEFVGKFEYHSKDVDIIEGKFNYTVKPKDKRYYVAWKHDSLSKFFLEHEKDKMITWLLKEEE